MSLEHLTCTPGPCPGAKSAQRVPEENMKRLLLSVPPCRGEALARSRVCLRGESSHLRVSASPRETLFLPDLSQRAQRHRETQKQLLFMPDLAISVQNVGKKYRIFDQPQDQLTIRLREDAMAGHARFSGGTESRRNQHRERCILGSLLAPQRSVARISRRAHARGRALWPALPVHALREIRATFCRKRA